MRLALNIIWKIRQKQALILEMFVALCLAFLIWLYAHCRARDTLDNVLIPVILQIPPSQQSQYELDIQGPRQVTVSFAGGSSRIRDLRRMLQRGQVKAIIPCAVPEDHLKEGRFSERIVVEPGHIAVPRGVRMVLMEDSSQLQVTFHRIVERQLPVRLEHPSDLRLRVVRLEPAVATVRGPQSILEHANCIATQPYGFVADPDNLREESVVHGQVDLVTEMNGRPIQTSPERITFTCRVQPRSAERTPAGASPTSGKTDQGLHSGPN
jgi:hypothetical protein